MDFQESDRAWTDREAKVSASLELTVHCQVLIHDHCATDKHFLPDIPIGKNLHDWGPFLLSAAEISESRGFSYELSWDHLVPSMTWNPSASFPQISKLSRPPYLFQYSHPSPLLLLLYFHAWLSSKSISVFREQRYSDMTYRHRVLCTPKREWEGKGEQTHRLLLVYAGAHANVPGCSDLSPAVDLTCIQISWEVNIDTQNNPKYRAQSLEDTPLVPFLLQALPTQLPIILHLLE